MRPLGRRVDPHPEGLVYSRDVEYEKRSFSRGRRCGLLRSVSDEHCEAYTDNEKNCWKNSRSNVSPLRRPPGPIPRRRGIHQEAPYLSIDNDCLRSRSPAKPFERPIENARRQRRRLVYHFRPAYANGHRPGLRRFLVNSRTVSVMDTTKPERRRLDRDVHIVERRDVVERLQERAEERGHSLSDEVRAVLREHLRRETR